MAKKFSEKVERCPNCGKLKSKTKPCKYCGTTSTTVNTDPLTWNKLKDMLETVSTKKTEYKYFVSYSHSCGCGGKIIKTDYADITEEFVKKVEAELIKIQKDDNLCILNIIKLAD